jgi:perosamine synthetase
MEPALILKAIKNCLPIEHDSPILLHQPTFKGNEWEYVKECLDTGWVSSAGKHVDEFEDRLQTATGSKHAIAVTTGTAALHLCLEICGVNENDEVLVPALSFVAIGNAVSYCNATPHFVDSNEKTLGVCPTSLESYLKQITEIKNGECFNKSTGRRIKALVVVHTFGHPVELDKILSLCQDFKIELIEDAAESLGTTYKEVHTGCWGKAAAVSFNGNKIITTGGGGAILTQDKDLARKAKHLSTTAKQAHPWHYFHDVRGYNYRLPNINAALGCAQLERLSEFVKQKRELAARYEKEFKNHSGINFFKEPEYARSNYWLNVLILDEEYSHHLESILELCNGEGVMTRPAWKLLNELPMFESCPRMELPVAESLVRRILNVPSSAFLGVSSVQA